MSNPLAVIACNEIFGLAKTYINGRNQRKIAIAEIEAKKESLCAMIEANRHLVEQYFQFQFAERQYILQESFRLLEEGLQRNNIEGMNFALHSITQTIQTSPLKGFQEFQLAITNNQTMLL